LRSMVILVLRHPARRLSERRALGFRTVLWDGPESGPAAAPLRSEPTAARSAQTKITIDSRRPASSRGRWKRSRTEAKGFKFLLDTKGGVSRKPGHHYKGKNVTIEEASTPCFRRTAWATSSSPKKGDTYDGLVQVRQGKERGYPQKMTATPSRGLTLSARFSRAIARTTGRGKPASAPPRHGAEPARAAPP